MTFINDEFGLRLFCNADPMSPLHKSYFTTYKNAIDATLAFAERLKTQEGQEKMVLLGAAVNTPKIFPEIFRHWTIDIRSFIFDSCNHLSFIPVMDEWTDNEGDQQHIAFDCVDIEQGYEDDPEVTQMIVYLQKLYGAMSILQNTPTKINYVSLDNFDDVAAKERIDKINVFMIHTESTGWPLGQWAKIPMILGHTDQYNFFPVAMPGGILLPFWNIGIQKLREIVKTHPHALYYEPLTLMA